MIIEKQLSTNDTVTIKTSSGEEIVARYQEETSSHVTVTKPMSIMPTPQGIGLGPFAFTISPSAKVTFNKSLVLCMAKTDPEMAKQYIQSTTGIVV
jgi:hypothetical protein